jgi:hypothetical protein
MYASPKAKAQSPKGKAYMMTYGEDFRRVITQRTPYRSGRKVIIGRQECEEGVRSRWRIIDGRPLIKDPLSDTAPDAYYSQF